ncbi:hypothetical protein CXB51_005252 [Gossypium anomalum]|uniref:Reverse transcriptase Ty1/copia-type domain-containing protein n=1 Tax=Gossypium anomalum TaxID=47600 RepID=A0A8J5ZBS3_9ROSI|nr:hypothetical protein CXB51_005252 [Gossypium anomalum]
MILAIVTLQNLEVHQMDVKTTVLNRDLDEEIYLEQHESHVVPGQEKKVCKLVKLFYGLKQAPKQWHEKFDNIMMTNGFKINECDKCVYVKTTDIRYIILCLYVDDILIVGSNNEMVKRTKYMLNLRFDMKDIALANVILSIQIKRSSEGLILTQSYYVDKILGKFSKNDSGIARTLINTSQHESVGQVEYERVIGSLMWLISCTRLDIAFTVSNLSIFISNPRENHWKAIVRILGYLRYTQDYRVHYSKDPTVLEGFFDAH